MRLPWSVPFLLVPFLIRFEDAEGFLAGQLGKRAVTKVMDEAVFGGNHAVAGCFDAEREVVVFEHADLEAGVELAYFVPYETRHQDAVQRGYGDVGRLSGLLMSERGSELLHFKNVAVIEIDFG